MTILTGEALPSLQLPIELLYDVKVSRSGDDGSLSNSYYATSSKLHDYYKFLDKEGACPPELQTGIAMTYALESLLITEGALGGVGSPRRVRELRGMQKRSEAYDAMIRPHGLTTAEFETMADSLSPTDVISYHMSKLESYTKYLAEGAAPTDWPEATFLDAGMLHQDISYEVYRIANVMASLSRRHIGGGDPEFQEEMERRYNAWVENIVTLLGDHRKAGWMIPLVNMASYEQMPRVFDRVRLVFEYVDATEPEYSYRSLYSFAVGVLRQPFKDEFIKTVPRKQAPLVPDARRKFVLIEDKVYLSEWFDRYQTIGVSLQDGSPAQVPYTDYLERTLCNYDTPYEYEITSQQRGINYHDLDTAQLEALSVAKAIADSARRKESTLPYYQRLAFKPNGDAAPLLYTVRFRDGFNRMIHFYPDHHGLTTSETEEQLDSPVEELHAVKDAWIVVPNPVKWDSSWAPIFDTDPNFFGPGEDKANAFWISGNPRDIYDEGGRSDIMRKSEFASEPRWKILPVRFYKVNVPRRDYSDALRFFAARPEI